MPEYYFLRYGIEQRPELSLSLNQLERNHATYSKQLSDIIENRKCSKLMLFSDSIFNDTQRYKRDQLITLFERSGDITLVSKHDLHLASLRVYQ